MGSWVAVANDGSTLGAFLILNPTEGLRRAWCCRAFIFSIVGLGLFLFKVVFVSKHKHLGKAGEDH